MQQRLVPLATAARYCGMTPATYLALAAQGKFPPPLPGVSSKKRQRVDLKALDAMLDKASGLQVLDSLAADEAELIERASRG